MAGLSQTIPRQGINNLPGTDVFDSSLNAQLDQRVRLYHPYVDLTQADVNASTAANPQVGVRLAWPATRSCQITVSLADGFKHGSSTSAGSEYTASSQVVTFQPGEILKFVTFNIPAHTIATYELVVINLSSPDDCELEATTHGHGYIRMRSSNVADIPAGALHVTANAAGGGDGSSSQPFTRQEMLLAANVGVTDLVLIRDSGGIYTATTTGTETDNEVSVDGYQVAVTTGANESNRIVYCNYPGESPVFDQDKLHGGFNLNRKDYVTFCGLTIRECKNGTVSAGNDEACGGIYTMRNGGTCTRINVENCLIHDIDGNSGTNIAGIKFQNWVGGKMFANEIHTVRVNNLESGNANGGQSFECEQFDWIGNYVHSMGTGVGGGNGVSLKSGLSTTPAKSGNIEWNWHDAPWPVRSTISGTGSQNMHRIVVSNNVVLNGINFGIDMGNNQGGSNAIANDCVIDHNLIDNGGFSERPAILIAESNTAIHSNIIRDSRFPIAIWQDTAANRIQFSRNNCFYNNSLSRTYEEDWTGTPTTYTTIADVQAIGYEQNSISSDPLHVDPDNATTRSRDYSLQTTPTPSPCIDTALIDDAATDGKNMGPMDLTKVG